jgi:hypothetical protein
MAGGILGRLRAMLGATAPADESSVREIFLDEDEYGEIEVLPAGTADWCIEEFRKIAAFAEAHQAPGGMGWTDIYLRPPAPRPLADIRLPLAATVQTLGASLPAFDRVVTGNYSSPEPIQHARAFGASSLAAVIVIADVDADVVRSILLVLREGGDAAADVMAALKKLPSPEPLIVVDWPRAGLVRL